MDTSKRSKSKGRSNPSVADSSNSSNKDFKSTEVNGENDNPESKVSTDEKTSSKDTETAETKVDKNSKVIKSRKRKASEMGTEEKPVTEKPPENIIEKDTGIDLKHDMEVDEEVQKANECDENISENQEKELALQKDDSSYTGELSDRSGDLSEITLGKGKRARIPNKRYSDIVLAPTSKAMKPGGVIENGEKRVSEPEPVENLSVPLIKARTSTGSPFTKKPKLSIDLSNPNYLKPFKHGWKRELVYRATSDNSLKRNSDIYYYTPSGKKVRSMREVAEHLSEGGELILDDFTFFKEALGIGDPDKEIIRDAKVKTGAGTSVKKILTPISKPVKSPKHKVSQSPKHATSTPKTPSNKSEISSPKSAPMLSVKGGNVEHPALNTTAEDDPKAKTASKLGSFKIKLPSKKGDKKTSNTEESVKKEMETQKRLSRKSVKGKKDSPVKVPAKKRAVTRLNSSSLTFTEKKDENKFMMNYLQHLSYGYNTLLYVFQYLKVQDLLRAGCVCSMWRDIASHSILWRTVRMKNSPVYSFEGLANTLQKHGTVHLDLRKMLLPGGEELWPEFNKAIAKVTTLRKIELCRCPATIVEQLSTSNPDLEIVNALAIKCETMNLDPISKFKNLKELRLKSTSGLSLSSDLDALKQLTSLRHLSITSVRDLNKLDLNMIAQLTNLESLDLGECTDFPENFGHDILEKLTNLEKLRLEKGQGNCHTFEILEAVKKMPRLEQLELVNFDIKGGFDKALGVCSNIKKLLIIPTYISQSATTNHMVLGGVLRLHKTLSHFVWGVTLELLRVTELFVDQCEEPDKKDKKDKLKEKEKKPTGNGDSIPVLKPVPIITDKEDEIPPAHDPPQVEILPLPNLQKLLLQSLPTTRVKILKIPFHATWRQSITDSVN